MAPHEFAVQSPGELNNVLYSASAFRGWRWMGYDELRDWQTAAKASYVVRPYYRHLGTLDQIMTPEGGDLSTATALMIRHIPVPHEMLPYPRGRSRTSLGLVMALNRRLPISVTHRLSAGTVAIVDYGCTLPSVDILPEPLRWERYLRLDRRAAPWLPRSLGRERNLPGGAALEPVPLGAADRDYFAPLAADPARAAAALSPAVLALTRESRVGWWSRGGMLFVWTHEALAPRARPALAEHAKRLHGLLAGR